ncbi:hypothetical protein ARMGADRAFT_1011825 [Armillaria gallica]|uniref:Uncharacterized protein n=1 Tax=Armillaria gallica TaxID=47427 RepID=A0A2H3DJD6_ARMGA|nr:hypothetical protein ARMGADRAFT_1011825 [Armillaria gallica]
MHASHRLLLLSMPLDPPSSPRPLLSRFQTLYEESTRIFSVPKDSSTCRRGECAHGKPNLVNYHGIMLPDGSGLARHAPRYHHSAGAFSMLKYTEDSHDYRRREFSRG